AAAAIAAVAALALVQDRDVARGEHCVAVGAAVQASVQTDDQAGVAAGAFSAIAVRGIAAETDRAHDDVAGDGHRCIVVDKKGYSARIPAAAVAVAAIRAVAASAVGVQRDVVRRDFARPAKRGAAARAGTAVATRGAAIAIVASPAGAAARVRRYGNVAELGRPG